jgi:hypothetical protein
MTIGGAIFSLSLTNLNVQVDVWCKDFCRLLNGLQPIVKNFEKTVKNIRVLRRAGVGFRNSPGAVILLFIDNTHCL